MDIKKLVTRAIAIREAAPAPSVRQRLANVAQSLSLAADNQMRVEWLNEAMLAMTTLLYETDPVGRWANIDVATYRMLVPAPWGNAGWQRWEMRNWEATILRKILLARSENGKVAPIFDYNWSVRQWYLNVPCYPQLAQGLAYWKAMPLTLQEWQGHADRYRRAAQARMQRLRSHTGSH